jgi:hypothetical protein
MTNNEIAIAMANREMHIDYLCVSFSARLIEAAKNTRQQPTPLYFQRKSRRSTTFGIALQAA